MISPCLRLNTEIVDTYHIQQRILFLQIASEASEEMPGTNMLILQTTVASLINDHDDDLVKTFGGRPILFLLQQKNLYFGPNFCGPKLTQLTIYEFSSIEE